MAFSPESGACDEPLRGSREPQNKSESSLDIAAWQQRVREQVGVCLQDLQAAAQLGPEDVLVIGSSTSEVLGKKIGTATSVAIGQAIFESVQAFQQATGCEIAIQCCEHLNRAVVVPRRTAKRHQWVEVSAIPVPGAGGATAAVAYFGMEDACLVEAIQADAGIDIGDTFIGMHLRRVAVPVRGQLTQIGSAHVTMARTRPPLFGGNRAIYNRETAYHRVFGSGTSS